MTAAKIDSMTACRWPGCTSSVHRRGLCARDCSRVKAMVTDGAAHWSDAPAVWATLWEDRTARIKAERVRRSREAAAAVAPAEPDLGSAIRDGVSTAMSAWSAVCFSGRSAELVEELAVAADITERAAALGMPAGLHIGTWWSTQLTEARERAREMEARANEAAAECERLRASAGPRDQEARAFSVNLNDYASVTLTAEGLAHYLERERQPGTLTGNVYRDQAWSLLSVLSRSMRVAGPHWIEGNVVTFEKAAPVAGGADIAAEARAWREDASSRELAALRTVVREAMEACDRAGVHEGLTPAERIDVLVSQRNLADHALADARERLERLGSVRDSSRAAPRLRAAVADALDIEGPVPPDDELVRRLRELDTDDDRDLTVVRDVIGACTGGLRRLAYDTNPPSPVAVDALCAVIERTVGVVRG